MVDLFTEAYTFTDRGAYTKKSVGFYDKEGDGRGGVGVEWGRFYIYQINVVTVTEVNLWAALHV